MGGLTRRSVGAQGDAEGAYDGGDAPHLPLNVPSRFVLLDWPKHADAIADGVPHSNASAMRFPTEGLLCGASVAPSPASLGVCACEGEALHWSFDIRAAYGNDFVNHANQEGEHVGSWRGVAITSRRLMLATERTSGSPVTLSRIPVAISSTLSPGTRDGAEPLLAPSFRSLPAIRGQASTGEDSGSEGACAAWRRELMPCGRRRRATRRGPGAPRWARLTGECPARASLPGNTWAP